MNYVQVKGMSLPDTYHKALVALKEYGDIVPCPDYNTEMIECSMDMIVQKPLLEPMISKCGIYSPKDLQQYMLEKEKQYKSLDTPLKKQNFETQTATEFNAKQDALMKLRNDKENQIMTQIQSAAKAIMVSQRLDAVLSDQVVFVGGVDITDLVIQKLKGQ